MILAIVVNWNGWRDTISCIESLCATTGPDFELLICDNGSTDGSLEHLLQWGWDVGGDAQTSQQKTPDGVTTFDGPFPDGRALRRVHFMRLDANHGYAGAANRGIDWGMRLLHPHAFWILNNDIRVQSNALSELAAAAQRFPRGGLFGSVLLEWDSDQIQAVAGMFNRWLAVGYHIKALPGEACVEHGLHGHIDYPVGASLFATGDFIEKVGTMDDGYFLYYEEIDWSERARRQGFRPAIAIRSRIHHREGASTGSSGVRGKSLLSEYYGVVSRLRVTRKLWPLHLPLVWLSLALVVMDRVFHGEGRRAALVAKLMFWPWRPPPQATRPDGS
jgi:GT2 family glycosyltransferase